MSVHNQQQQDQIEHILKKTKKNEIAETNDIFDNSPRFDRENVRHTEKTDIDASKKTVSKRNSIQMLPSENTKAGMSYTQEGERKIPLKNRKAPKTDSTLTSIGPIKKSEDTKAFIRRKMRKMRVRKNDFKQKSISNQTYNNKSDLTRRKIQLSNLIRRNNNQQQENMARAIKQNNRPK
ncbi:MAG: hypothetical protein K5769_07065 [Pseudobutyrivibrio sp.]|nr:hypothetical protein [Pseudobutyrivibrio sp.]